MVLDNLLSLLGQPTNNGAETAAVTAEDSQALIPSATETVTRSSPAMKMNKNKKNDNDEQEPYETAVVVGRSKKPSSSNGNGGGTSSLPLSMRVMSSLHSCSSRNCSGNLARSWHPEEDDEDEEDFDENSILADYDLQALRRQGSSVSPMVVAPMLSLSSSRFGNTVIVERIISEYVTACRFYGCETRVNAGVLTALRFSLPCLRVSSGFFDSDMLALAEVLLRYMNGPLRFMKRLDFSVASKEGKMIGTQQRGFRSHGAFTLSKVLQKSDYIEQVNLQRNRIGPYGASAVFIACSTRPNIKKLVMRRCLVGERGALAFAEWIVPSSECGLVEIDLSANYIGFKGSFAIESALKQRNQKIIMASDNNDNDKEEPLHEMNVDLEGNLVLQEVMNGVTHGLGVLLAFLGSYLMWRRVRNRSHRHQTSCAVYSTSLVVLYISSTLYHSFFTMQNTKYIFAVLDKCAIYILIAGSYTPFLQIVLWQEPMYSVYLLTFIWVCCFCGICVEAFCPSWQGKGKFSLAMYLGMGWSAMVCLPEVSRSVPEGAMNLMVLGGVGYTAGVPFFVRDNNLDHAIWHLFVLAGSFFHWCGIYFYVANFHG